MSIFVGNNEITGTDKVKLGGADIAEVYVGATKVWPTSTPPEIEIQLVPGETSFGFQTTSIFTVEQDGTTAVYTSGGYDITGMNDASFIKIVLLNNLPTTVFKFVTAVIVHIKLNSVGKMLSLKESFKDSYKMTTFERTADLSKVTNFNSTWDGCTGLTMFDATGLTSGTNFANTWDECLKLVCFTGTDFSSLTNGTDAFRFCPALTAPALHGTPVRDGDNATAGTWTNPNPCP